MKSVNLSKEIFLICQMKYVELINLIIFVDLPNKSFINPFHANVIAGIKNKKHLKHFFLSHFYENL